MFMLYNKSPIMWKSKMQKTTALFTAEAEYYSVSMAGWEVFYLRALLHRLGFAQKKKKPPPVYEDNTTCIEWGSNVTVHGNVPSTSTSGSTSPTKLSRMVRCSWSITTLDFAPPSEESPAVAHAMKAPAPLYPRGGSCLKPQVCEQP